MRHFSGMTPSVRSLAHRMPESSGSLSLVVRSSPPQGLAPADRGAPRGAVDVAVITATADAHQAVAPSTVVKPVILDDRDPAHRGTRQRSAIAVFKKWEVAFDDRDDPPEARGGQSPGFHLLGGGALLHQKGLVEEAGAGRSGR